MASSEERVSAAAEAIDRANGRGRDLRDDELYRLDAKAALRAGDVYDREHGVVRVRASDIALVLASLDWPAHHEDLYNRLAHAIEPLAVPADLYEEATDG